MALRKRPLAALDSSLLLLLEAGSVDCARILSHLERLQFDFIVTDTALQRLIDIQEDTTQPSVSEMSRDLLGRLRDHYGFKTPGLAGADDAIAKIVAGKLLEHPVLHSARNTHALIIVEAALHGCEVLLSSDPVLLRVDGAKLNVALMDHHVPTIQILSPAVILSVLDA